MKLKPKAKQKETSIQTNGKLRSLYGNIWDRNSTVEQGAFNLQMRVRFSPVPPIMKTYKSLIETKGPYNEGVVKAAIHLNNQMLSKLDKIDGDTKKVEKLGKEIDKELNKVLETA